MVTVRGRRGRSARRGRPSGRSCPTASSSTTTTAASRPGGGCSRPSSSPAPSACVRPARAAARAETVRARPSSTPPLESPSRRPRGEGGRGARAAHGRRPDRALPPASTPTGGRPAHRVAVAGRGRDRDARSVRRISSRRARGRLTIQTGTVFDETGPMKAVWFNQPWLVDRLPVRQPARPARPVRRHRAWACRSRSTR